jgi:uncharacterized phage-associated protein
MAKINEKKYENAILYIISELGGVLKGKKKLAKLLYFADFDYYEKYEDYLTGDEYRAQPMGPLPINMTKVVSKLEEAKKIKLGYEKVPGVENECEVYESKTKPDLSVFSKQEKAMLSRVVEIYGGLSGGQLENLSHLEAPYTGTKLGKPIMYELALYRGTDFSNLPHA